MSGEQSKSNLDATTAGSNFDTLFKIETPIKGLLKSRLTSQIRVDGTVYFIDEVQRIAKSIIYHLTWNQNKSYTVEIDPLSIRFPTRDEAETAIFLLEKETLSSP